MGDSLKGEVSALERFQNAAQQAIAERRFSPERRAPKAQVLREAMPTIRALQAANASLPTIRKMLQESGVVTVSLKTLRKVMRSLDQGENPNLDDDRKTVATKKPRKASRGNTSGTSPGKSTRTSPATRSSRSNGTMNGLAETTQTRNTSGTHLGNDEVETSAPSGTRPSTSSNTSRRHTNGTPHVDPPGVGEEVPKEVNGASTVTSDRDKTRRFGAKGIDFG